MDDDEITDHNRRTDRWHFEKRLSLDTLVALVGAALVIGAPMYYWGRAMENRVLQLEVKDEQHTRQETARDIDARDQRIAVLSKMEKLDDQVTQLRIDVGKLLSSRADNSMPMMGGRR